jgi:hypothetical protein
MQNTIGSGCDGLTLGEAAIDDDVRSEDRAHVLVRDACSGARRSG